MSCLFDSLAPTVGLHSKILRQLITRYLSLNPEIYSGTRISELLDGSGFSNPSSYAHDMSQSATWGSAFEIKAFCNLFRKDVHVHYHGKIIDFIVPNSKEIVELKYNGSHYTLKNVITKIL